MKKEKKKSEFHGKVAEALKTGPVFAQKISYVVDKEALTEQLLKDDSANWLIEKGATMILKGETPGKNMILMLEHLNIIKVQYHQ